MTSYELSRAYFDWAFINPTKIRPIHTAIYFYAVEICNRLGWKNEFSLPTAAAKEALGIKSYNAYIRGFNDLVDWGFINLIQKAKNQNTANIIALSLNVKASDKALDRATIRQSTKQGKKQRESKVQSKVTVNKQVTNNQETINKEQEIIIFPFDSENFKSQWDIWKDYKFKTWKFKFKTTVSEQAALKELNDDSGGREDIAIKIIHKSIACQWQGLFEPKNNKNGKSSAIDGIKERFAEWDKELGGSHS